MTQPITPTMLWSAFLETSRDHPGNFAVVARGAEPVTFDALRTSAERCAAELRRRGILPGGLVALSTPNEPGFVIGALALAKLGATIVLVPPKLARSEWQTIWNASGAFSLLTTTTANLQWGKEELRWTGIESLRNFTLGTVRGGPFLPARDQLLRNVALIKFTSGSSGVPKGIGLTARNLAVESSQIIGTLGLGPGSRIAVPVPLTHSYGFDLGFLPMVYGGATMLLDSTFIPPRALEFLASSQVDVFLGVPSMYHFLVEAAPDCAPRLSHIRYPLSCTAPLAESLVARFHQTFGAVICQHYGSSETGAVANHVPSQVLARPGSAGRAMRGVEIEIRDPEGEPLGPGEEGEIFVRSGAVADGYIALAPTGTQPFRDGGYYMGDLGVLDDDGFLEVRGRRDSMINVGGFKVSPLEVKRALEDYAPVREAAVFGATDDAGGQVVRALVTLKSAATETGILAHCRRVLSDYKVPRRVEIVHDLPRGATGKVRVPLTTVHA